MPSSCKLFHFLLLLVLAGCSTVGRPQPGIQNFDQVSDGLFRGAQPTREGVQTLAQHQVKTVINLRDGDDRAEARMVRDAGMTYLHLPLKAETVTPADADRFLALLASAPAPVFVHCMVGRDRTGLAVAAYRMRDQGWSRQAALKDLYDHGHNWLFYPKVRAAILALTLPAPMENKTAALTPDPSKPKVD